MKRKHPFLGFRPTAMERARGRLLRAPDHDASTGGGEGGDENENEDENLDTDVDAAGEDENLDGDVDGGEGDDDGNVDDVTDLASAKKALAAAKKAEAVAKRTAAAAKKRAAQFVGIDPKKARENAKKVKDAEAAQRAAEKAAATAEGNFERLREIQNEEHKAELEAANAKATEADARALAAEAKLAKAQVTTAFASSKFISGATVLSPIKAQRLFGDYVEFEDGDVVVYDKPKGAARRAKVMDKRGSAIPFNDAIKQVIEADDDKDTWLISKVKPGGSSKSEDAPIKVDRGDRMSRLASGIKALREG